MSWPLVFCRVARSKAFCATLILRYASFVSDHKSAKVHCLERRVLKYCGIFIEGHTYCASLKLPIFMISLSLHILVDEMGKSTHFSECVSLEIFVFRTLQILETMIDIM